MSTEVTRLRRKIEKDPAKPTCLLTDANLGYRFSASGAKSLLGSITVAAGENTSALSLPHGKA